MSFRISHLLGITFAFLLAVAAPASTWGQALTWQEPVFIENRGQWDRQAKFLLRSNGLDLWVTNQGLVYDLRHAEQAIATDNDATLASNGAMANRIAWAHAGITPHVIQRTAVSVSFVGASPTSLVQGLERTGGYHNYFVGNNRSKWATDVLLYSRVQIDNLYNGIDAVFYLDRGVPRYDLMVLPGADVGQVRMKIEGANGLHVVANGTLAIETSLGTLEQRGLYAYQQAEGEERKQVACRFVVDGSQEVRFELGSYDRSRPLVIDPILYSTYLGGTKNEDSHGVASDGSGNTYVTGSSQSPDFPVVNAAQSSSVGGTYEAYVTKLTPDGALAYSTYLGGAGNEGGWGIAVDARGNAYVAGSSSSLDFPMLSAAQSLFGGESDGFVAKLTASGALAYSTYLGGSALDNIYGIAADADGDAYVAGYTFSTNVPMLNAEQMTNAGKGEGFVTKLTPDGALSYSTYLGGTQDDACLGIAVDGGGNAYITGQTVSSDFPLLNAAQSSSPVDFNDAFVVKLTPGGALAYSTYLGGSNEEEGNGIAVDERGNAYVTGTTLSANFPVLNAIQPSHAEGRDIFVTRLAPDGAFAYSTYFGGAKDDQGLAIDVDGSGNAYVTGYTASSDFPTLNAEQPSNAGGNDVVIIHLTPGGLLSHSSYFGGSVGDVGLGIAVDGNGNACVVGYTNSSNFPTFKPVQSSISGYSDAFVTKFSLGSDAGLPDLHPAGSDRPVIVPNPASDELQLSFTLEQAGRITVELFTADGRRVRNPIEAREYSSGKHLERVDVGGLSAGSYVLRFSEGRGNYHVQLFVVAR